jgi:hypothetical protein
MGYETFKPEITAELPSNWFSKESITLLHPEGQANVIASSEPLDPEIDVQQYAEVQGRLLRDEFPGYREYEFSEALVFGGRPGYIRAFSWSPPPDEDGPSSPVRQIQLYYAENGRGYTATATAPTYIFERLEGELRRILEGLQLEAAREEVA